MQSKKIIAMAVEVVTFLFAAFGGFLANIAPPDDANPKLPVGLSMLLALVVLLFIAGAAKGGARTRFRKRWMLAAGVFLVVGVVAVPFYVSNTDQFVYRYPPETLERSHLGGTELTQRAAERMQSGESRTIPDLVADFGGPTQAQMVWTPSSITRAKLILLFNYIAITIGFAGAVFCLTEGVLARDVKEQL